MPDIEAIAERVPVVIDATVETVTLPPDETGLFLCLVDIGDEACFAGFEHTLHKAVAALRIFSTSKNRRILRIVEPK